MDSAVRWPNLPPLRTNEDHWLWWACCGYVTGKTTIEEYERAVDDALHGRPVHFNGRPMDARA